LTHHFTIFGTVDECGRLLKGYQAAGLTAVIARVASDDVREQSRMLLNDIKPRLTQ
jgi:hypothetical protein